MLSETVIGDLKKHLTDQTLSFATEERICYSYDAVVQGYPPDVVVFPTTAEQVMHLVRYALPRGIPVVARGAGSGCCGGGLCARGGILLSFEGMDRIVSLDSELMVGVAEPGVITSRFQKAVKSLGLFYPPDPSSAEVSTLGGNLGHGAGGLQGRKYGTTKDYVLGVEAVTAEGDLIRTGYFSPSQTEDLTGLLVGSEGTLAIVTKMALRLLPRPESFCTQLFLFALAEEAVQLVQTILGQNLMPAAMEYMDSKALDCVRSHGYVAFAHEEAHVLLVEFSGRRREVHLAAERVRKLGKDIGALAAQKALTTKDRQEIWSVRRALSPAMAHAAARKIGQDVCVPPSAIAALLKQIEILSRRHCLSIVTFGHLGDGNIHVNFMTDGGVEQESRALAAVEDLLRTVLSLGGTISGEHGIGLAKAKYLSWELSPETLEAHRRVKAAFDPRGLLNPDKLFH